MQIFSNRIFNERILPENSTEKRGISLFFSIIISNWWELIALNMLFILCSIPVVTMPAAITAMSRVTLRLAREEVFSLRENFIGEFKDSFGKSLAFGSAQAVVLVAAAYLVPFYRTAAIMSYAFYIPLVLVVMTSLFVILMGMYVYPMLGVIELTFLQIVKNSALLVIARLHMNALAFAASLFLILLVIILIPVSILIIAGVLFSLTSFICSFCAWSGICKYVLKGGKANG